VAVALATLTPRAVPARAGGGAAGVYEDVRPRFPSRRIFSMFTVLTFGHHHQQ
jgi:hypothetical protein